MAQTRTSAFQRDIDDLRGPPIPLRAELAWGTEGTPKACSVAMAGQLHLALVGT